MTDFRINVKVTNANIQRSIEGMGYSSIPKWCEAFGYEYGTLNAYISLKLSPLNAKGDPKPSALKLCELLGESFCELFSEHQLDALQTNRASVEVSFEQIAPLLQSDGTELLEAVFANERTAIVDTALRTLSPRDQDVLRLRFGLTKEEALSLSCIADRLGITTERVRQIEIRALQRLRAHPSNPHKMAALLQSAI